MSSSLFVDPVFIKHVDISECDEINTVTICSAINQQYHNKAVGAQIINMVWLLYLKDADTKTDLVLKGLKIDLVTVPVYKFNPLIRNTGAAVETEKITIQNLPLYINNDEILNLLKQFPQVIPTSKVLFGKGWDKKKTI